MQHFQLIFFSSNINFETQGNLTENSESEIKIQDLKKAVLIKSSKRCLNNLTLLGSKCIDLKDKVCLRLINKTTRRLLNNSQVYFFMPIPPDWGEEALALITAKDSITKENVPLKILGGK